ncbi:MAG: DUF308 domain-containing protein [Draconibacterium sp.]|nr:DUF308 domain-containing protein [Draconibacterium sp.]
MIKLSLVFGLIIIVGGVLEIALALQNRKYNEYWGRRLTSGILDLLLGAFLVANPSFMLLLITILVSIWLVFKGILSVRYTLILKKNQDSNWIYGFVFGTLLIVVGVVFVWHPEILGITLGIWAALAFISLGVFRIVFVFNYFDGKNRE